MTFPTSVPGPRWRYVPWGAGLAAWAHALAGVARGDGVPLADAPHYLAIAAGVRTMLAAGHPGTALGMASELAPNPGWVPAWMGTWMLALGASEAVGVAALLPFHVLLAFGLWRGGRALAGHEGGLVALLLGLCGIGVVHAGRGAMLDLPLVACAAFAGAAALEGAPRTAMFGVAGSCWTKLAAGPSLAGLALDALVGAWRGSRAGAARSVLACAVVVALGYGAGVGGLFGGYAGESGNVAEGLRGVAGLGARASGLAGAALVALQPPLLLVLVSALLTGRGGRPLLWAAGVLVGLLPFTLTPQPRYLLPAVPFVAFAAAALLEGAPHRTLRAFVWGCALLSVGQAIAFDAGVHRGVGPGGVAPEAQRAAGVDPALVDALAGALARLDAHARAGGHDPVMRRAVLALALPDRPELAPGVASWLVAREEMALVPVSSRAGHPLRSDADLALVVRCGGAGGGAYGRAPDRVETWPGGCVAQVWEGPILSGATTPRTAR